MTDPSPASEVALARPRLDMRSYWAQLPKHQFGLLTAVIGIGVVLTFASPVFLTSRNLTNIAQAQAVNAIIAAGVTVVMLSGSVDISMGGVLALTGMVTALATERGLPAELAIVLGLLVAMGCGLVNAGLVVGIGINPIVATLGTQFVFRGCAYMLNGGATSLIHAPSILYLGRGTPFGVPVSVIIMVATYTCLWVVMGATRWGRHIYATGGSESAARRSGVRVRSLRVQAFVICALGAGIGGLVLDGLSAVSFPQAGFGSEFIILGSVIVGGTTLLGVARGGVIGTLLGIALFGVIFNGFNLLGLDVFLQQVAQGLILILAVIIDDYRRRKLTYV